ncbi:hypothetical protein HYG86_11390 [Alkalicella caledoniensis]|uniref:Uncharacterized protein n=1 Tax=Alkalicella caledoniensis TaxID=2731377 RepID=A0A7G9W9G4_ALKCA|nr:hypothetical protein [Alkalicella caledoniensis]QNO15326.1 hypothetical protein HYG86_11390 [Alkalicella caledoniensis]
MELTFEEKQQKILDSTGKIFEAFTGMTKDYVKLIREHHKIITADGSASLPGRKIAKGMYSDEYISQHRATTKEAVKDLKKAYIDKAKEVVNSIKEEYGVKLPKPPVVPSAAGEQMRYQLERNNNLILWQAQLGSATIDELKALHQEHQSNPDFMILLEAELRKRDDNADLQRLRLEIQNPVNDKAFEKLNQIAVGLDNLNQIPYFPANVKNGFSNISYRNVDDDLDKFPIPEGTPGIPYRPVFDIVED